MPAVKVKPSANAQRRDFWGDTEKGNDLALLIEQKFGSRHGHVKHVLVYLKVQRRLLDMYKSGERRIPDDTWARLKLLPDYNSALGILNDWATEEDPLS